MELKPSPSRRRSIAAGGITLIVIVGAAECGGEGVAGPGHDGADHSGFKFHTGRCTINLAPADAGIFDQSYDEEFDMAEVKGQESVKRALESRRRTATMFLCCVQLPCKQKANQTMGNPFPSFPASRPRIISATMSANHLKKLNKFQTMKPRTTDRARGSNTSA